MKWCCLLALLLCCASLINSQTQTPAGCIATNVNATFITYLIQTVNYVTEVQINVTNPTNQPVYYVQFSISGGSPYQVLNTGGVQATGSQAYTGHYTWDVNIIDATAPNPIYLRFTPSSGTTGVSCRGTTCSNSAMETGTSSTLWTWEMFTFYVTNYHDPTFPWIFQASWGSIYPTFGPLDESLCNCANCDAGYYARVVQTCNLGYTNAAGDYIDTSTSISETIFNENICMYSFAIVGNWLEMYYTDEHPMMLGYRQVIDNTVNPTNTTNYNIIANTGCTPTCVGPQYPTLSVGSTIFNPTSTQAAVDLTNWNFDCYNNPTASPPLYCQRPMPPVLYITDITTLATNRSGDWQFGGQPYLPHKVCGLWKSGYKNGFTKNTTDGTYTFTINVDADPDNCNGNSVNGITWNFGPGSDPLPFLPGITLAVQTYGTEVGFDLNAASLGLDPSRSYRFQFFVHDGDQNHNGFTGGDIGQACIQVSAACPAGFAAAYVGGPCDVCDLRPTPFDGSYVWYCFPTNNASNPYTLLKIPTDKLGSPPYAGSGGFAINNSQVDAEGYNVTCNCQRIVVPCPNSCCGNGICYNQNGSCKCNPPVAGFVTNTTSCCLSQIPPPPPPPAPIGSPQAPPQAPAPPYVPPCFNNGSYCSGHGICNSSGVCHCQPDATGTSYNGVACQNPIIVAKPPSCESVNVSTCVECIGSTVALGLNCIWCAKGPMSSSNVLTNGTCQTAVANNCPPNNVLPSCAPPAVFIPPPCPDNCTGNGVCVNKTSSAAAGSPSNAQGNYTTYCACNPHYSGINCGAWDGISETVVAATVSAAAIAGIIVGIALCVGLAGGGSYAFYANQNDAAISAATNNPLYRDPGLSGVNPLNKDG